MTCDLSPPFINTTLCTGGENYDKCCFRRRANNCRESFPKSQKNALKVWDDLHKNIHTCTSSTAQTKFITVVIPCLYDKM